MIATSPNVSPIDVRELSTAYDNASAVTMPGNAIGSTRLNETASRPKNANRWTANDARLPRSSAIKVGKRAARIHVRSGRVRLGSVHATESHFRVNSCGGQDPDTLLLNA